MALAAFACLAWVLLSSRADAAKQPDSSDPKARGATAARPDRLAAARGGAPPNILVIVTDDQRKRGSMSVMDDTRRLFARGGVTFPNAYVTTPQCSPSRASLFSGQYAHNHGVTDNQNSPNLDPDETFQRYLDENGYRTGFFGKYLAGVNRREEIPHFDESFIGTNPEHATHDPRQDSFIAGKATRFLRQAEERDRAPWLLVVGFRSPHKPFKPERQYRNAHVPGFESNPATDETDFSDKNPSLSNAQVPGYISRRNPRGQRRMLLSVDDGVERIFSTMERRGEQDALSFYTSDNGYYWGEHDLTGKFLPYLDSLRVPLFMRWPGVLPENTTDERLAANIDIAPTILQATGAQARHQIDGRSLLASGSRDWLMFEGAPISNHDGWPSWRRSYFDMTSHYFRWLDDFEELYDLDSDPWELQNIAGERPDEVAQARARLEAAADCAGASCP